MAWTHMSMNFVEGVPKSNNKDVILVIVDRFTKYAHFLTLSHPFTVKDVINILLENIFKLHGIPTIIESDRDMIFTSNLWQALFKSLGVNLHFSTAYHPETDGKQRELINVWRII